MHGHGTFTDSQSAEHASSPATFAASAVDVCVSSLRWSSSADAQPAVRRATNIAAILAYPRFYHLRPVLLVGTVAQQQNGEFHVSDGTRSLRVIPEDKSRRMGSTKCAACSGISAA